MILTIHFDGACEPNPGGVASCGWIVRSDCGTINHTGMQVVAEGEKATNNYAEWCALGLALKWLHEHGDQGIEKFILRGDSQLVINQLTGKWQCHSPMMARLRDRCLMLLTHMGVQYTCEWVPREQNIEADGLSQRAYENHTGQPFPQRVRKKKARK